MNVEIESGLAALCLTVEPPILGAGGRLEIEVSYPARADAKSMHGRLVEIRDETDKVLGYLELARRETKAEYAGKVTLVAPLGIGSYTWRAAMVLAEGEEADTFPTTGEAEIVVDAHALEVTVWDVPDTIEAGAPVSFKVGVACSSGCTPSDWIVEIRDEEGHTLTSREVTENPWLGSKSLHYVELRVEAPGGPALHKWSATVRSNAKEVPHQDSRVIFPVRIVPKPEYRIEVRAVDADSQKPIKGAKVVAHPYRTMTGAEGVGTLRVPAGRFKLFVSGLRYHPFSIDTEIAADTEITATLHTQRTPTEADLWT